MRAVFAIALLLLASSVARADDARDLFDEGTRAIHADNYGRAIELLEQSLALRSRPATAYNLVLALELAKRPLQAESVCAELLAGRHGELDGAKREEVSARCATLDAQVPRLVVEPRLLGAMPGPVRVEVDGRLVATLEGAEPTEVRVEPGEHVVRLSAPGAMGESATVELEVQDRRRVTLTLRGVDSGSADRRPLRLGLGIAGGLVGAAILSGVLGALLRPGPGPSAGDLGPAGT